VNETPLRNEDGPRDWVVPPAEPHYVVTKSTALGWKLATLVLAISTIVLAMVLAGQLAGQAYLAEQGELSPQQPAPAAVAELDGDALGPMVNALDAELNAKYSASTGWPSSLSVDDAGTVRTPDGTVIGAIPAGYTLLYDAPESGGYSLNIALPSGQSSGVSSSDYESGEVTTVPAVQLVGTMAYLLKAQYPDAWPAELVVDATGNISGPDGFSLGVVPAGGTLRYLLADDGQSFELDLLLADGTGARYSSVTDRVEVID